jgi:hypothetical protein
VVVFQDQVVLVGLQKINVGFSLVTANFWYAIRILSNIFLRK